MYILCILSAGLNNGIIHRQVTGNRGYGTYFHKVCRDFSASHRYTALLGHDLDTDRLPLGGLIVGIVKI